ncbi:hypothetical protein NADFUDRAFT_40085 [Nadsonia fulvescens var. elongata DSM 6958]|uniref:Uncharacterized protein n=1 Tax=Nadsonia fulvescens var. elongata DSM 6958 TaxID=857566 RepID=A0A1E3PNJ5_9ASCO|nr:hypothetical protein NADFUDRAFT_40085 [Nadsonia fulvescens var. elongata DSM 6958]
MLKWKTLTATLRQILAASVPPSTAVKSSETLAQATYQNQDRDEDSVQDEDEDEDEDGNSQSLRRRDEKQLAIPSRIHGCLLISPAATLIVSCHLPVVSAPELVEKGIVSPARIERMIQQDRISCSDGADKVKALFVATAWAEYIRSLATIPSSILVHTKQGEAFYVYPVKTGGKADVRNVENINGKNTSPAVNPYLLLVVMAHTNVPAGMVDRRARQVVALLQDGLDTWKFYDDTK